MNCSAFCHQVRTKLESLDGIVPPTNGFMISSTGMRNVWLSMEHQAILWCNQLVVQVSATLFLNSNLTYL
jgi:glycosylphosphatidylinositol deacylase